MRIKLSKHAGKQYHNLSHELQRKTSKQFEYLLLDMRHPSLHVKKYNEHEDLWQGRIDKNWRFYFHIISPEYIIISIILHPK